MNVQPHIERPDDFYAALVEANEGLSLEQSVEFDMRLVFLLANQVGDAGVLKACVERAHHGFETGQEHPHD